MVVNIALLEIELIKRWVTNLALQGSLTEIFFSLLTMSHSQGVHIYTDGSMIKSHNMDQEQKTYMGAGWMIKDTELSFKYGWNIFPHQPDLN